MLQSLLSLLTLLFVLVMLALHLWATLGALALILILAVAVEKAWPSAARAAAPDKPIDVARPMIPQPIDAPRTADGRFPLLNEDWIGETVFSIDDPEIPDIVRRHGARFRNPARYVIDLGNGEYLLYGADGELLDLCWLK